VTGSAGHFEYWSLAKAKAGFGYISQPTSKRPGDGHIEASSFVEFIKTQAEEALGKWIIGTAPFAAKLHPEYANYEDYNQLMRLQEWDGRQPVADSETE
jgi:ATP-dependent helicase/nuclease subunit B